MLLALVVMHFQPEEKNCGTLPCADSVLGNLDVWLCQWLGPCLGLSLCRWAHGPVPHVAASPERRSLCVSVGLLVDGGYVSTQVPGNCAMHILAVNLEQSPKDSVSAGMPRMSTSTRLVSGNLDRSGMFC